MPNNREAFIVRIPSHLHVVRIPNHLHAKIKSTASANRRSMNNEIVWLLEKSYEANRTNSENDSIKTLLLQQIDCLDKKVEAYERACGCPSFQCAGGEQIADTGDYDDAQCPH